MMHMASCLTGGLFLCILNQIETQMEFITEFNNLWDVVKSCDDIMERMGDNAYINQHAWVIKAEAHRQLKCLQADK